MKTTYIFITAITVALSASVMAENSQAPGGPYRSITEDTKTAASQNSAISSQSAYENKYDASQAQQLNRAYQNPYAAEAPEWVKKRQAEMQDMMKQHHSRMQAERGNQRFQQAEVPQWVKQQQQKQMEQRLKQFNTLPPQGWNNQPPPQWNPNQVPPVRRPASGQFAPNNKMNFPSAAGPVFRPRVAPPGFNNQPGSRGSYPPAWR